MEIGVCCALICDYKTHSMSADPDDLVPTRWSLINRLKNWDDQTSWREFFDTYWRLIYSVATRAGLTDAEAPSVGLDGSLLG